jgi:hypothetical protein
MHSRQANDGLKVFISNRDSVCDECKEQLGHHAWIQLAGERGALCLACADLDHLAFLASGDAALTRRARKHSNVSAVVLKWSRARKQYERQGLLIEEQALALAEQECLTDEAARSRRREREAVRVAELDRVFVASFAERVRKMFPGCPPGREHAISEHACRKCSGRVGRSAAAKRLDEEAVRMAGRRRACEVEQTGAALGRVIIERYGSSLPFFGKCRMSRQIVPFGKPGACQQWPKEPIQDGEISR